jgi:hypothetical protein
VLGRPILLIARWLMSVVNGTRARLSNAHLS